MVSFAKNVQNQIERGVIKVSSGFQRDSSWVSAKFQLGFSRVSCAKNVQNQIERGVIKVPVGFQLRFQQGFMC